MQRGSLIALCVLGAGVLASCTSTPAASPSQLRAQAEAKAKSAVALSADHTNVVLSTFAQDILQCGSSSKCSQGAAASARDSMTAIIRTYHSRVGSYDGERYTAFVYSTALSYLRSDFGALSDTFYPAFDSYVHNALQPHVAQFRSSGSELLTDFGAQQPL